MTGDISHDLLPVVQTEVILPWQDGEAIPSTAMAGETLVGLGCVRTG